MAQGFWPDIISSDINTSGFYLQPLHSLPRIMSKYLELGMSLEDVLDAVTIIPARLLGRPELASMDEGTTADIGIFDIRQKRVVYCDKAGHTLEGSRVIVPQLTMKDGKIMNIKKTGARKRKLRRACFFSKKEEAGEIIHRPSIMKKSLIASALYIS